MSPEEILLKLRKKKDYEDLNREISDDEIADIEKQLDVDLPDDYVLFLKSVGYVFWFGVSFYGVAEHKYESVVYRTKYIRDADLPADFESIPEPTIVFTDYGGGGYYFLYCKGSNRCGQVVELLNECMYRESKCWPDI